MKATTEKDLSRAKVKLAHRCAECGNVLDIQYDGKVAMSYNAFATGCLKVGDNCYCEKCVAEYANQKDLEE